MNKKAKYTFNKGMNRDISKYKHPNDFYYEGDAIRIINTDSQSLYSVSNEKGNKFIIEIPNISINSLNNEIVYGDKSLNFVNSNGNEILNSDLPLSSNSQIIIGHTTTRDGVVLLTTDNLGFDCIWYLKEILNGTYDLELLYCRNLNFNSENPIQVLFNYENETIQKIYWVDGENQLRFLNIAHSIENGDRENLIDLNSSNINIVSDYKLSQPVLDTITGGSNNTAGVIQYAYNLYRISGSQTTLSPFSEIVSLDNGLIGGGDLNEIVGVTPNMIIPNIDENYTNIRIYSIKYTSYNETPEINLIQDSLIDTYDNFRFSDDGNNIRTLTLSEFIFLGGNPILPSHIESKDNRLFAANLKDTSYDLDIDMRAYSHNTSGETLLFTGNVNYINGVLTGQNQFFSTSTPVDNYNYLTSDDAINPNYDIYKYHKNGSTIGGEGKFIKYTLPIASAQELNIDLKYAKFFKNDEIYRIGIQFYNKLGQTTDVKWIADFKARNNNLIGSYNILNVELNTTAINNYFDSINLPLNERPVGYKILRAEREIQDRTILCQGSMTQMMVQTTRNVQDVDYWNRIENIEPETKLQPKIPIGISRGFTVLSGEATINSTGNYKTLNNPASGPFNEFNTEIYTDTDTAYKRQRSWQYTRMMQMHSPDILFNTGLVFGGGLEMRGIGVVRYNQMNKKYQQFRVDSQALYRQNTDLITDRFRFDNESRYASYGFIGPVYDSAEEGITEFRSFNRIYANYSFANSYVNKPIYGSPEITERGQGVTNYNGDAEFAYTNSLESLVTDDHKAGNDADDDPGLVGLNSYGERSLMIVLGNNDDNEEDRPTLESMIPNVGSRDGLLLAEIVRPTSYIYSGSMYGGNSIEDKSRTSYIEIGEYTNINISAIQIDSPGDTYVQIYKFARLSKTDTEVFDIRKMQFTEIIEHKVETTVNLENRSDISLLAWDNKFQPRYDEYHNYNRVYSQDSNLIRRQTDDFNFRKVNNFDTRIISSKLKIPNETIDSWTDFLENDTLDLDGKYGAINCLVNTRDEIYALQDTAVSRLSINPRIQTQGNDGVSIELGRGAILYDYNYLSTQSGTLNKWSVHSSPTSFYYFDIINKSYMRVQVNEGVRNLSDQFGFHSFFQNNIKDVDTLLKNNPILLQGVSGGYDVVNSDSYLTFFQNDDSFTLRFNEKNNAFQSFHPYLPSRYINKGDILLTTNPFNNQLYIQGEGNYNEFYGKYYPSSITLLVNPEVDVDCTFNNIEFKSEAYIDNIDQPNSTLTHMTAWNEYQNTGRIELVLGRNKNLRRKFRIWRAIISRNQNSRDRIRNPWIFLKLELDKNDNTKFILNDIIINYTPHYL